MIRCYSYSTEDVNLKSSAYNQTGQSYFEQLDAYNCMSSHLRRVLRAKSIVDSKNVRYVRSKFRPSSGSRTCRSKSAEPYALGNVIDALAYDTKHHPLDFLRMNSNSKRYCIRRERSQKSDGDGCESSKNHSSRNSHTNKCNKIKSPTGKPLQPINRHKRCFEDTTEYWKKGKRDKRVSRNSGDVTQRSPRNRRKNNDPEICGGYSSSFESSPSSSDGESEKEDIFNRNNCLNGRKESSNESLSEEARYLRELNAERDEDAKYAKFVYDITQEIVQNSLYTDAELKKVFRKHLQKNEGVLQKNKMLYEIYQLKTSLNLTGDSDDEEFEEFIHAHKFNASSGSYATGIKPPTPPKILNEDKIYEKLESYKVYTRDNRKSSSNTSGKNVILVDANPELLITEKDVLLTLMEMDIDAKRAEQICKSLQLKSKDSAIQHSVEVETKQPITRGSANKMSQHSSKPLIGPNDDIRGTLNNLRETMEFNRKHRNLKENKVFHQEDENKKQIYMQYSLKSDRKCICPETQRNLGSSDIKDRQGRENITSKFLTLKACRGGIPDSSQSGINATSKRAQGENGFSQVKQSMEEDENVRYEKKGNSRISWTKPVIENKQDAAPKSPPAKKEEVSEDSQLRDSKITETEDEDDKDIEESQEDKTIKNGSSIANGGNVPTDTIEYEESLESDSSAPEISEEELNSDSRSKSSISQEEKISTDKLKERTKKAEDSSSGEESPKQSHTKSQSISTRPKLLRKENESGSNVSEVTSESDSND